MTSCSGGLTVQKRKYSKGFFITSTKKIKKSHIKHEDEDIVVATNTVVEPTTYSKDLTATEIITVKEAPVSINEVNEEIMTEEVNTTSATKRKNNNSISFPTTSINETKSKQSNIPSKLKKLVKKPTAPMGDTEETILLVLLSLFIPPLAVFLYEEASGRFWIDLIAFLLAAAGLWVIRLAGILWFFAVIYALLIVLGVI